MSHDDGGFDTGHGFFGKQRREPIHARKCRGQDPLLLVLGFFLLILVEVVVI